MIDKYLRYVDSCLDMVPASVGISLILVFCLGSAFFLVRQGWKKGLTRSAGLLLLEYLLLLLLLSVFIRSEQAERTCMLTPFWSYPAIQEGQPGILTQVIMNVAAFVPIGFLFGCIYGRAKWWKALLLGGVFSIMIEILQFAFKRGMSEFDDVFHNVLGCLIGYGLYVGVLWIVKIIFIVKLDAIRQS